MPYYIGKKSKKACKVSRMVYSRGPGCRVRLRYIKEMPDSGVCSCAELARYYWEKGEEQEGKEKRMGGQNQRVNERRDI